MKPTLRGSGDEHRKGNPRTRGQALRGKDRGRSRVAREAAARRAALHALLGSDGHEGELAAVDEVRQDALQIGEMQRPAGARLRRRGAGDRQSAHRGGDQRPAEDAQADVPQRLGEDPAGMEVRRLAVRASAGVSGDFKGRREDDRLLTGGGRYTADQSFPGQLHACFVRSDRAHAEILSLAKENALKSPGVVAVFTGQDTAEFKTPPPMVRFPGRSGAMLKVPHRDILARGRVRYVGQEIALVVATSPAAAQDAAEKIETEFNELPPVVDAAEALKPGAPQLHDDVPGNLAATFEYGNDNET